MSEFTAFEKLSPADLADVLPLDRVMNFGIHPLWQGMPRVAGPAYTVRCVYGDNLMLHAAIYRAPPGSIIVVESGDTDYAVAGGKVCAVAQNRGIAAFVVDGVIRDLPEVRARQFAVFARGVMPIPGGKEVVTDLNVPIKCGGVEVAPGDIVVADEEGIVVVPHARRYEISTAAQARAMKDAEVSIEDWECRHRAKIEGILKAKGFAG
jgi:4-hydroxy-4-methyl-2-oxoglutarate aldolase